MTRARDLGDFIADGGAPELVVDTTTLVVDSTNNRVGVGTASPATALDVVGNATITTADNSVQLTLVSTDADANAGPILKLRRNSASPADNDLIGAIDWTSENSSGDEHDFLNLTARMRDVTAGSEDVAYAWTAYLNGTGREIQSFVNTDASAASMVFNEDSQDIDFRVESNGNANMLFVDAGNDRIGIGTGVPSMILDVDGSSGGNDVARFSGPNSGGLTFRNATSNEFILHTATSDALIFGTNGNNERFRIGTAGQLGIGGATYGTAGQVLTSGGSGAAPSWVDASGGGSTDFTATGSITAGNLVGLTSTGTVKVVPALLGDPNEFKDEGKNEVFGVYEPNSGSVLVTFQGTSNRGFCKVGTVSGNTISFGSEVQFSGNFTTNIHDVFLDTTNNNVIIMYQDESNSDRGYIISGTLSGQSVTFGSELNWTGVTSSAGIYSSGGAWDASAQRIVAVYFQGSDSSKTKVAVISTGGTGNRTLTTQGTPAQIGSQTSPSGISVTYDSTAQKTIATFLNGATNKRVFVAMTVASTSVTQGTIVEDDRLGTGEAQFKSAFIPGTNKVAYVYKQTTGPDLIKVGLITLSGTTITQNETTMAEGYASLAQYGSFSMIGTANGKFMVFFADSDQNAPDKYRCTYGKFSGTTAVFEKNDFFFSNDANRDTGNEIGHISYASGLGKFLLAHRANNTSTGVETCTASFGVADDMEVFENTIGLATQSVSDGATVTVTIVGGINENQSGLTVGQKYFLGQDGTLTNIQPEGFFPSDRIVGIATAATKLLITNSATTISMDGESALIGET